MSSYAGGHEQVEPLPTPRPPSSSVFSVLWEIKGKWQVSGSLDLREDLDDIQMFTGPIGYA